MKKRLGIICLFTLLFATFIAIWDYSYRKSLEPAYTPLKRRITDRIPLESGVFRRDKHALDYADMAIDEKHRHSIADYYRNRAFPGAPPTIPHPLLDERSMGGKDCLSCHENGGFVPKWNAYAPVTPHPEMINCRQCHVAQKVQTQFRGTNFEKIPAPAIGKGANRASDGRPPVIPHSLQMRENCLACHAGPSAPKEIRTQHPQLVNCMQCHISGQASTTDQKPLRERI